MAKVLKKFNEIFKDLDSSWDDFYLVDLKIIKSKSKCIVEYSASGDFKEEYNEKVNELFKTIVTSLDIDSNFIILDEEDGIVDLSYIVENKLDILNFQYKIESKDEIFEITIYEDIDEKKLESLKEECSLKNFNCNFFVNISDTKEKVLENSKHIEDEFISNIEIKEVSKPKIEISTETEKKLTYRKPPKFDAPLTSLKDLNSDILKCTTTGEIFKIDFKDIKNGEMVIMTIYYSDNTESIYTKLFLKPDEANGYRESLKTGMNILVIGELQYDDFLKSNYIRPNYFEVSDPVKKIDNYENKRVELHAHTNMSMNDGMNDVFDLIKKAKEYGHDAIAITDHAVVQAYPEAMYAVKDLGVKVIYGMEAYVVDDSVPILRKLENLKDNYDNFVVFDLETTGLSSRNNKIIEIGAVKIQNNKIVDTYNTFIDPEEFLDGKIIELTNITDEMLKGSPKFNEICDEFRKFIKDSILVAHNAEFDIGFLENAFRNEACEFNNPYIDTLELSRILNPDIKSHRLGKLAKKYGVSLVNAHRAIDDAMATAEVFLRMIRDYLSEDSFNETLENLVNLINIRKLSEGEPYHAVILVKTQEGLQNLYKLVSLSHTEYFNRVPIIPKSIFNEYRDGLLISTACQDGELFKAILNNKYEKIEEIVNFYDYFEVQPVKNYLNLVGSMVKSKEEIKDLITEIVNISKKYNKILVATGDVHYISDEYRLPRQIIKHNMLLKDRDEYNNDYSFLTTDEMIKEFDFLGNKSYEIVIENSNKINDLIEEVTPLPSDTFPPVIEGSDKMLREISYNNAHKLYGENIPKYVKSRMDTELDSIIKNGYSVLYIIARKLVKKANEDGYLVGSRGSVGSSFVANLCEITEVNPLKPHYLCKKCHYSEFLESNEIGIYSGHDLPHKKCPQCGEDLERLGDEIPFEVFLGFDGDKEPDIDLNFAGEYQVTAHKYVEELFGTGKVFRAGTIGKIKDKTAYGYVLKYIEESDLNISKAHIEKLSTLVTGVKRTTGQHAGGIMIVPDYKDIHDFTPIQKPANKLDVDTITTHFDYAAISGIILKLDILGHDVPSMARMLEDFTNTDILDVPFNDEKTMSLFNSSDVLNYNTEIFDSKVGTLGIPEFGTNFVQNMLEETKPKTFSELTRISGLSHGTDVWSGNADELVRSNQAELKDLIATREDIMQDLINAGADKKFSFFTMEKVRKGKGLSEEEENLIRNLDLPSWYIDSLNKIQYMFPKAHAVAYVSMAYRLAYYKINYPLEFYATYLTTKIDEFDIDAVYRGEGAIKDKIQSIRDKNMNKKMSKKDDDIITVQNICLEIKSRGIEIGTIDLYNSEATKFIIRDEKIIPPFMAVPGLGESVAEAIVRCREEDKFISIEDFRVKTKTSSTCIEFLKNIGVLDSLSNTNQMSLF